MFSMFNGLHSQRLLAFAIYMSLFVGAVGIHSLEAGHHKESEQKKMTILDRRQGRTVAQLSNGLLVLVQELKTAPVVSTQAWVKCGAIYEGKYMGYGISHYLEHLASGGSTKTSTEAENNAKLSAIGANTNASTSMDFVRYYINCLSQDSPTAIDLMSDWMQNCAVNEREFERERSVILREFEMGRGEPSRVMWKLTQLARYKDHPARHPIIGYQPFFEKITRQDIIDFHAQYYVPNNMVFVVVGDIKADEVLKQVEKNWGALPSVKMPEMFHPVSEMADYAEKSTTAQMDVSAPRARIAWPGTTLTGDGDYALDLVADVLGDGESSRLIRKVRDELRLVNSISCFNYSTQWGKGIFAVDFEVPNPEGGKAEQLAAIEKAKEAILAEIEKIIKEGVEKKEMDAAKRRVLAHELMSSQSVERVAEKITNGMMGMGDPDYMKRWVDGVADVTSGDIQKACSKYLVDDKRFEVLLLPLPEGEKPTTIPTPEKAPGDERPLAAADGLKEVELDNKRLVKLYDEVRKAAGESGEGEDKEMLGEVKSWTLSNGLRVRYQNSKVVPAVSMQLYRLGGLLDDNSETLGLANAMAVMQMRGTETRDQQTIATTVESLGAGLTTGSGDNSWYTQAECLSEDFGQVFELFADVTLNANFPEKEWERLKPRLLAAIDRQSDQWYGELQLHFRKNYFGDHPWGSTSVGKREVVDALTAEQLKAHYKKRLVSEEAVLVIVGDVAEDKVRADVEKYFSKMPSKASGATFKLPVAELPQAAIKQYITQKPLAAVQIAFAPGIVRQSDDFPAVEVLVRILSNFPSGRLDQAMRGEGEGLVYAVWAGQKTGLAPGYIAGAFNCGPDKLVTALNAAADVFAEIKAGDFTEEEVEKAKLAVLTDTFFDRQSNSSRAAEEGLDELYQVKIRDKAFEEAVRKIDVAQLKATAKKYLATPVINIITAQEADEAELAKVLEKLK